MHHPTFKLYRTRVILSVHTDHCIVFVWRIRLSVGVSFDMTSVLISFLINVATQCYSETHVTGERNPSFSCVCIGKVFFGFVFRFL